MSLYRTVVISFNSDEYEEDEEQRFDLTMRDCEPLRRIDDWLLERGYDDFLKDLTQGSLCSNVVLWGGTYDGLDIDELVEFIHGLEWNDPSSVRVLFWDEEDATFTLMKSPS